MISPITTAAKTVTAAVLVLLVSAAPVWGQSLFNAAGLGTPVEALDGRARALGSMGIGLGGPSIMPTDPGGLARLGISTGVMAASPSWVDYSASGDRSGSFQGNRFPLVGIGYPFFGGMASVQFGSFLDQSYEVTDVSDVDLGDGPVRTSDAFSQDGSISNVNLGFARAINGHFAAGLTVGRYAGSLDRTLVRTYGDEDDEGNVDQYIESGVWSWAGWSFTAGGSASFDGLEVAASVQMPSMLSGNASGETRGSDRSFSLPIQYRLGATANLGPSVLLHSSVVLADWSKTEDELSDAYVTSGSGFGVGLELSRARLLGKDAPLRFGFRRVGLPFAFEDESVSERTLSSGFGLVLNETAGMVLARIDMSIERGRRSSANLTENFWRATLSLLTSGF
ncbi:MAG: hypothetical protein P8L45_08285 [Longimicrobiales bacterium]|nr:hypothetical protein [Longimicrobiales bacterium]